MLYVDEESGEAISTHSMLKTFRRCPKQAEYKYVMRLKPRVGSLPLKRGTWMHSLLEWHYKGLDWREKHAELTLAFADLFDEEKEAMGDLPRECARLMRSYLWHYGESDPWIVHETELTLETEFPDGTIYRGRIDALVENQFGLWIVDHKTHKRFPDFTFRMLDAASALYIWAAIRNKIPVQGFIWNYLKTKPPTIPQLLKNGSRLSARAIETDYPTMVKALRTYDLDPKPYSKQLRYLKSQRYQDGAPQTSPFFHRAILEKNDDLLKRIAREGYHTSRRMHEYPFHRTDFVERVPDRSCTFMCSYLDLCQYSLFAGEDTPGVRNMMRQRYTIGDPMDYYYDNEQGIDKEEITN